jgi:hypothetical protein
MKEGASTLYDATGKLFDVSNCTFAWALLDPNGNPVVPLDGQRSRRRRRHRPGARPLH